MQAKSDTGKGAGVPSPKSAPSGDITARSRAQALSHPWRVRILEVLNERDMSVAQFVDEGWIPELSKTRRDLAISDLAYHFRKLRSVGALVVVDKIMRRGGTEYICRGGARAYFTDSQWSELSIEERRAISVTMLQGLIARAESAIDSDTFDTRLDRHLAWLAMSLDEEGWADLVDVMAEALGAVTQIHHDSRKRLKSSGEAPIQFTWGQLGFESPPVPSPGDY